MSNSQHGTLTWLGHASYLLTTPEGKRIAIDPFLTDNPGCPDAYKTLDNIDLVLLTHGHDDHIADAERVARANSAQLAGPNELMYYFTSKGIPQDQTIAFNKGGTIDLGYAKITMTHAHHSSSAIDGDGAPFYTGEPAGYVVELSDGFKTYFAGDTCVFGDMRIIGDLYAPELAVLPIGGHFTMDPREAAYAVELLGTPQVLGMHYGTWPALTGTPAELRALIADNITLHEIDPGSSLELVRETATASA